MNVLICGATGFIGQHLTKSVFEQNNLDLYIGVRDISKVKKIFPSFPCTKIRMFDVISGELDFSNIDMIFNLTALVPKKNSTPQDMISVNVLGTLNILEACLNYGVKRLIHSSSMAVFGFDTHLPVTETSKKNPSTLYGVLKKTSEEMCTLPRYRSFEKIILRYSSVYGLNMDPKGVSSIFFCNLLQNKKICVNDNSSGDFIYIKDVINANLLAANFNLKNKDYEVFNIGSGRELAITDIAHLTCHALGKDQEKMIQILSNTKGKCFYFDITKANQLLGFYPAYNYEKGIKEMLKGIQVEENYRNNLKKALR